VKRQDLAFWIVAAYAAAHFCSMRLFWDIYASPIRGSDFSSYYAAGTLVREGRARDLYAVGTGDSILGEATAGPWAALGSAAGVPTQHYYIYPPFFALLCAPLSLLPFASALNLWLGLDVVLLGAFAALWVRTRGAEMTPPEAAFVAATCLFEFLPLIWAMAVGQTSLIVLVLLTGTLLAWKRGSDTSAGILLGLAVAIKLTPALLSVFFWWRGKRRVALVSAAVFVAAQAASILMLGWGPHRTFYLDVLPLLSGGTCYFLNQSLGALFNRLLTDADVTQVTLVNSPAARALALIAVGLLAAMSAPFLRGGRPGTPLRDEIQFGVVLLLGLAASPISWTHHYLRPWCPSTRWWGTWGGCRRRRWGAPRPPAPPTCSSPASRTPTSSSTAFRAFSTRPRSRGH